MSRCYADRVEVLRRNEEPAHFLWRSRLYVVRGVLAHWVETGEWWRSAAADAPSPEQAPAAGAGDPERMGAGSPGGARAAATALAVATAPPAPTAGRDEPVAAADEQVPVQAPLDEEREIWRVEASSGRSGAPGVFDLCFAWSSGAWTLVRAAD